MPFSIDKKYYKDWRWGLIEGLVIGIVLFAFTEIAITPIILVDHYFMTFWIFIMIFPLLFMTAINTFYNLRGKLRIPIISARHTREDIMKKAREARKPCKECGSIGPHKLTCSKRKKV